VLTWSLCLLYYSDVILNDTDDGICVLISQCFLKRSTHKFRSEFGKSRLVRDKEKVLVAFSGGRASSAMIHLIEQVLTILMLSFCCWVC